MSKMFIIKLPKIAKPVKMSTHECIKPKNFEIVK